jgi:hypothetical protein
VFFCTGVFSMFSGLPYGLATKTSPNEFIFFRSS